MVIIFLDLIILSVLVMTNPQSHLFNKLNKIRVITKFFENAINDLEKIKIRICICFYKHYE